MSIYQVHARISENGGKWGEPGDQLQGKGREEVERVEHYGSFTKTFRWKDRQLAERAADFMCKVAAQGKVGYSQNNGRSKYTERTGLLVACREYGWSPDKWPSSAPNVNCDCSSLIMTVCRYNDLEVPETMYTGIECECLRDTEAFVELPYSKADLEVGDILWRNGHTAMIVEVEEAPRWEGDLAATGSVWIREAPTGAAIGEALPEGTQVKRLHPSAWYYVQTEDGRIGYVSSKYTETK